MHTPVGPIQQEEYTFILQFNQPVTNLVQHNFLTDFEDGETMAIFRKNQNRISGEPYTFNFDGNMPEEGLEFRAWYCEGTSEATAEDTCDDESESGSGAASGSGESGSGESEILSLEQLADEMKTNNDTDWQQHSDMDFMFLPRAKPLGYGAARKWCRNQEGALASPKSLLENTALAALIGDGSQSFFVEVTGHYISNKNFRPLKRWPNLA